MRRLYFILLLLPAFCLAQHQLKVTVTGVAQAKGNINIGLYTASEGFLNPEKHYKGIIVKSKKGSTIATFEDLPNGSYAVAVFHDENANEELDSNFFGIPKEPLGFSIGKLKTFGPPSFEECSFTIDSNTEISVPISD